MNVVYTIGHGTRTIEELVAVLRAATVERVADVRRFPGSRRNPHFSRDALEASLPGFGLRYEWWGEQLGGRRATTAEHSHHPAWRNRSFQSYADHMDTASFRDALVALESVAETSPTAVMCAETLWWRCHRRLIADALTLRRCEVVHLIDERDRHEHKLHPAARSDDEGWPVYDVGETAELDLADRARGRDR